MTKTRTEEKLYTKRPNSAETVDKLNREVDNCFNFVGFCGFYYCVLKEELLVLKYIAAKNQTKNLCSYFVLFCLV